MSDAEVEGLFQRAGEAQNGTVGVNDLANLLQQHQLEGNLFKIIRRHDLLACADVLASEYKPFAKPESAQGNTYEAGTWSCC